MKQVKISEEVAEAIRETKWWVNVSPIIAIRAQVHFEQLVLPFATYSDLVWSYVDDARLLISLTPQAVCRLCKITPYENLDDVWWEFPKATLVAVISACKLTDTDADALPDECALREACDGDGLCCDACPHA